MLSTRSALLRVFAALFAFVCLASAESNAVHARQHVARRLESRALEKRTATVAAEVNVLIGALSQCQIDIEIIVQAISSCKSHSKKVALGIKLHLALSECKHKVATCPGSGHVPGPSSVPRPPTLPPSGGNQCGAIGSGCNHVLTSLHTSLSLISSVLPGLPQETQNNLIRTTSELDFELNFLFLGWQKLTLCLYLQLQLFSGDYIELAVAAQIEHKLTLPRINKVLGIKAKHH